MKTIRLFKASLLTAVMISVVIMSQLALGQTVTKELENAPNFGPIKTEKGMMISSREVRLKPDVDIIVFDKWINEYWNLEWEDLIPGFQSYILKRDDELDPSSYAHYLLFNAKNIKDPNFSDSDENIHLYREFIYYEPTKHLYDELFEYIETDPFFKNIKWIRIK